MLLETWLPEENLQGSGRVIEEVDARYRTAQGIGVVDHIVLDRARDQSVRSRKRSRNTPEGVVVVHVEEEAQGARATDVGGLLCGTCAGC